MNHKIITKHYYCTQDVYIAFNIIQRRGNSCFTKCGSDEIIILYISVDVKKKDTDDMQS